MYGKFKVKGAISVIQAMLELMQDKKLVFDNAPVEVVEADALQELQNKHPHMSEGIAEIWNDFRNLVALDEWYEGLYL